MRLSVALLLVLANVACTPVPPAHAPGQAARTAGPPAAQALATLTPQPTVPPPPTPQPRYMPGEPVIFTDGWQITLLRWEEQPPSRFATPAPGMRLIAVIVRFDNGSSRGVSPNPFYFYLQDSTGVRRGPSFFSDRNDELRSSEVAPGAFVVGSVVFEAPVDDEDLELIYEQLGYSQVTFALK